MQKNLINTELSDELRDMFSDDNNDTPINTGTDNTNDTLIIKSDTPDMFLETDDDVDNDLDENVDDDLSDDVDKDVDDDLPVDNTTLDADAISYKALLSVLNDEGLIDFEDSDDLQDSPDLVFETVKKTITDGINQYKESIPEEGKQFLDYLEKGGDPSKFFEVLQKPVDLESLDLDSTENQKLIIKEYLKTQDFSDDEIDETINDLEDSLLLEKQAKTYSKKLEKVFEKRKEQLLEEQAYRIEEQNKQYAEYISNINQVIDSSDVMAGLPITKKEKEDFRSYLLDRDKSGLTRYEKDLQENSVKTQLELAYLKYKKYDFNNAVKKGETVATQKFKNILKSKDSTVKGQSNKVDVSAGDKADFSAFKAFNS